MSHIDQKNDYFLRKIIYYVMSFHSEFDYMQPIVDLFNKYEKCEFQCSNLPKCSGYIYKIFDLIEAILYTVHENPNKPYIRVRFDMQEIIKTPKQYRHLSDTIYDDEVDFMCLILDICEIKTNSFIRVIDNSYRSNNKLMELFYLDVFLNLLYEDDEFWKSEIHQLCRGEDYFDEVFMEPDYTNGFKSEMRISIEDYLNKYLRPYHRKLLE